jgi:tripartite-type tricarboxylate transporter receptor subunit TctC
VTCCVIRCIGVASIVALALQSAADAQVSGYPSRPIRFVVPYPAGGPVDLPARLIADRLVESMGQQIIIDNRGGAATRIGTEAVARSARDGYTLLFNNSSHAANVVQYRKLPYDAIADFAPVTLVDVTSGNLLVIHPSVAAHSIKELIALAKKRPAQLKYATGGVGGPQHVTAAVFAAMAGIELMHVPYKGTLAGMTDVLGGRLEIIFLSPSMALPFIKEGRLRALGVTGQRRLEALPDVPAIHEAGLSGYEVISWHGMWFPAGVPGDIVRRMHAEVVKALTLPHIRKQFEENYIYPVGNSPAEFADFVREQIAVQGRFMKIIGLEPE